MCMLDLSAAIDTVNHDILLHRLQTTFGVTDSALQWFRSYLQDRKMKVSIKDVFSPPVGLDVSVPQGSILGPQLYSVYTKPLGMLLRHLPLTFHAYADDTQLMTGVCLSNIKNQQKACRELSDAIQQVQLWTTANKLKLNPDKTEFIAISSTRNIKKININELQLPDASSVKRVDHVKNLGVLMDSSLSLQQHVSKICQVCYYYITWIKRIRHTLDKTTTKLIVQALVISRLDYCNAILVGAPNHVIVKLQRVLNAAARLVSMVPRDTSITAVLKDLHWLPMKQRIQFKVAVLVFKALHDEAPVYMKDMLAIYTPPRALRSANKHLLTVKRTRTEIGKRAFSVAAPILWNSLPEKIKSSESITCFRKNLKTFLFTQAYS